MTYAVSSSYALEILQFIRGFTLGGSHTNALSVIRDLCVVVTLESTGGRIPQRRLASSVPIIDTTNFVMLNVYVN
jgi:hypothetical protein